MSKRYKFDVTCEKYKLTPFKNYKQVLNQRCGAAPN